MHRLASPRDDRDNEHNTDPVKVEIKSESQDIPAIIEVKDTHYSQETLLEEAEMPETKLKEFGSG